MRPLTDAIQHAVDAYRAAGLHAVADPRDVSPPCVLVLPAPGGTLTPADLADSWDVRLQLIALGDGGPALQTVAQTERMALALPWHDGGDRPTWDATTWSIPATGAEVIGLSTTITLTVGD